MVQYGLFRTTLDNGVGAGGGIRTHEGLSGFTIASLTDKFYLQIVCWNWKISQRLTKLLRKTAYPASPSTNFSNCRSLDLAKTFSISPVTSNRPLFFKRCKYPRNSSGF